MEPMFEKIENLLNGWTYPIKRELYMRALEVLAKHGSFRAWTEISQYIEYTDEPASQRLDTIESLLSIDINYVLEEHTIYTNTTLDVNITILEAILNIQIFEDTETILRITEEGSNEIDVFIELLTFASNKPWEYFSDGILSVSESLITRLRENILELEVSNESASYVVTDDKVKALNKYIEKYPTSMITTDLTEDLGAIGSPLYVLQNRFKIGIAGLEGISAKQAAVEIVGLVLMSDTAYGDIASVVKEQGEIFYGDMRFITDLDIQLDNVLREVFYG